MTQRRTREIKSHIGMPKATSNKDGAFYPPIALIFKKYTTEVLHLRHSCVWCWNSNTSESRSEIPGKLRYVVLQKDGNQLEGSCEKWRSIT